MKTLKNLVKQCVLDDLWMECFYEIGDEPDYEGKSAKGALEALEACDEMNLVIYDDEGQKIGWAFVVNEPGQDPEEQICDYSGSYMARFYGDME